ncbi:uncharacterized protein BKA78DRAFT_143746 [Phyllosticta capitalensis]|uniref:uncharacterized protein n=1 Tax=Phyllosticta capitalensis TaxID=121624 RepID=UPI00312F3976
MKHAGSIKSRHGEWSTSESSRSSDKSTFARVNEAEEPTRDGVPAGAHVVQTRGAICAMAYTRFHTGDKRFCQTEIRTTCSRKRRRGDRTEHGVDLSTTSPSPPARSGQGGKVRGSSTSLRQAVGQASRAVQWPSRYVHKVCRRSGGGRARDGQTKGERGGPVKVPHEAG